MVGKVVSSAQPTRAPQGHRSKATRRTGPSRKRGSRPPRGFVQSATETVSSSRKASLPSCGPSSVTMMDVEGEGKLIACAEAVIRIYRAYGFSGGDIPRDSRKYGSLWATWCGSTGLSWVGLMKYKLAAFYAAGLGQPLPPRPVGLPVTDRPDVLLGGRYFRWCKLHLRTAGALARHSFLMSMKFSKNDMPRPGWYECALAAVEGFTKLTTERDTPPARFVLDWADFPVNRSFNVEGMLSKEVMIQQIRRTVKEVFVGTLPTTPKTYALFCETVTPTVPSTSACFEQGRVAGGTAGYLHDVIGSVGELTDFGDSLGRAPPLELPVSRGVRFSYSHSRTYDFESDERISNEPEELRLDPFYSEQHAWDFFRVVRERALDAIRDRENPVRIAPLAEALKVRNITAGRADLQYSLHLMQKFLWRSLRAHHSRVFTLIGETISDEFVASIIGRRPLAPDESIISVDYSDCTNNLCPWASEAVADELLSCGIIGSEDHELLTAALTGHMLRDPLDTGRFVPQQHGQLMGSIVSFPVLCIINAAVLRWVSEMSRLRTLTLRDAHCAVNGDDGILRGKGRSMYYLERVAAFVGLPLSVGKVYDSREFFDMNSRVFHLSSDPRTGKNVFTNVPFVQMRMLSGLTRSGVPPGPVWTKGQSKFRRDDRVDDGARNFVFARALSLNVVTRDLLRQGRTPSMGLLRELAAVDERLRPAFDLVEFQGEEAVSPASVILGDNERWPLGRTVAEFLLTAPKSLRVSLYAQFLGRMKRKFPVGIPWFVPATLGGLGLPILWSDGHIGLRTTVDDDLPVIGSGGSSSTTAPVLAFGPSSLDRKVATCIYNKLHSGQLDAFDYSVRPEWRLRAMATTLLPRKGFVTDTPTRHELEITSRVNAILTMEAYLTSLLESIFVPLDKDKKKANLPKGYLTARTQWRLRNYKALPAHGLSLETMFARDICTTITPVTEITYFG